MVIGVFGVAFAFIQAGYVAPAKALAMMAVDLLANDAAEARKILADSKPSLTKDQYLTQQKAIFASETWDPATV